MENMTSVVEIAGRSLRHTSVNDLIKRALASVEIFYLACRTELPVSYTNGRNRTVFRLVHGIREMGFHLPRPAKVQLPVKRKFINALNRATLI